MRAWFVACVCGALLAFAQPPWNIGAIAGIALAPWFVAIARSQRSITAFAGSFLVGLTYGSVVAIWIPDALRELGASTQNGWLGLAVIAAWGKGVPFAIQGVLLYTVRRRAGWIRLIVAAAATAAIEQASSTFRLGLPWALLGHTQGLLAGVAQLAAVSGVPLISALLVAVNHAFALCWESRGERSPVRALAALCAAWLVLAWLGLPLSIAMRRDRTESDTHPVSLLLVQPNIPRGERWAPELQALNLNRLTTFTEKALAGVSRRPDAIVWPENVLTTPLDEAPAISNALDAWVAELGIPLILGATRSPPSGTPGRYRSSVLWVSPSGGVGNAIDKVLAVPVLEAAAGSSGTAAMEAIFGGSLAGPKVEEASGAGALRGTFTVTPLLCYEALFPSIAAERRAAESIAILNLADDSWTQSRVAREQLLAFARFRAIEARLTLVRVAHGGISAVVDPYGRTVEELPRDAYAFAVVEVARAAPASVPEKIAIVLLPLATGLGVWWASSAWGRRGVVAELDS